MKRNKTSKSKSDPAIYPPGNIPFVFFNEIGGISTNRDLVRLYLIKSLPCLNENLDETRPEVVAELGMGLHAFALTTIEFYGVLKSMMDRGVFNIEIVKEFQALLDSHDEEPTLQVGEEAPRKK